MTNKPKKDPIPENVLREELAKFWDTHSVADYLDELKPVKVTIAKHLSHVLRVEMPLDPKIIDKLYTHAQKQGIDMNILVRRWILENVKKLEKRQAARSNEKDR